MTVTIRNIIIIGAGGNLGRYIVSALDTDPRFTVSILTRKSSRSTFPSHIPVHRVGNSYPETELVKAFTGQDAVISTVSVGAVQQQKLFIDAAIQARVKRFIPSEFGHDTRNEKAWDIFPQLTKVKAEIVMYLKSKENDGLEWSAFVTGPFFDLALENFLGYNLTENHATVLNDGSDRWSATTRTTVGHAVKNALLIPEQTANQYLFIDSVTASQNEILVAFEKATGTKWKVTHVNAEVEKATALESLFKGDFSAIPKLVRYITCVNGYGGNYLDYETSANQMLNLPHESVDKLVDQFQTG